MTVPSSPSIRRLLENLRAEIIRSNDDFTEACNAANQHNAAAGAGDDFDFTSYPDLPAWIPLATAALDALDRIDPARFSPTPAMLQAIKLPATHAPENRFALADQVFRAMMQQAPHGIDFIEALHLSREPSGPVSRRAYDYLELPLADRSAVIDRLLKLSQIAPQHPRLPSLMTRHVRLKGIALDIEREIAAYTAEPYWQDNDYLCAGYDRELRNRQRVLELQRRNTLRGLQALQEVSRLADPAKLIDPLAARAPAKRCNTPPVLLPLDNDIA